MDSKAGSQSTEQLHYKSGGSDNKIPLILSILAVLIAVIGVIIAAVGLARSGESNVVINGFGGSSAGGNMGESTAAGGYANDERIWMFQIGHADNNAEYLDEATGQIKGYHVDIVNAVCRIARKNCELVEDIWTNCWHSQTGGGTGVMARYYDACAGWYQTFERHRTFKFADPIAVEPNDVVFAVPKGNPGGFDHTDITGKVIAFGNGWAFDETCVRRDNTVGGILADENIRHYPNVGDVRAAVLDGSADAAFAKKSIFENEDGLDIIDGHATNCDSHSGRSMMMRKDNKMTDWWNPAFAALVKSHEYQLICNDLIEQHGHFPGVGPEICIKS